MRDNLRLITFPDIRSDEAMAITLLEIQPRERIAMYLYKTKRAFFRKINQHVHGWDKPKWERLLEFQNAAFGLGATVFIGIKDSLASEFLYAPVHELAKRKYGCICAACRTGNSIQCQNGEGGMVYWPVTMFRSIDEHAEVVTVEKKREPEQIDLFG